MASEESRSPVADRGAGGADAAADASALPATQGPPGPQSPSATEPVYGRDQIGALMEQPVAVMRPSVTVEEAVGRLRELVAEHFITYVYVTDEDNQLEGVVAMRELLLARPEQRLDEIMLREPFALRPDMSLLEGMREAVNRHYPVYPVCDRLGRLVGLIRGHAMFERQAIEISAQPGQMVGVEKEETMATPWPRCFRLRYPWLQFNLVTAFAAAAVIAIFEATIEQIVALAVFLPVLAGQAGNTGAQALAVTLRGLTIGEIRHARERLLKEALLGVGNGLPVGITAALAMYMYASTTNEAAPLLLATVVFMAMMLSCILSGVIGAGVPLMLRRAGADPAMASSILLTTATDVVSMGFLLGFTAWLVL